MDASVTFRFPALAVRGGGAEMARPSAAPASAAAEISDEALVLQICQGSREALAALFRRYAKLVRAVAYRVLRDASEADDLLQDTFLLIDRKCRLFDPARGPARSWILQVTYHNALARRRYLNSRHFYTRLDIEDVDDQLTESGSCQEGRELADAALGNSGLKGLFESLSDDQRQTLRLCFVEGYTLPEIATKLNQSHGNVKHHYFRGLEKLRKHVFNGKLRGSSAV
jgi:RNA polymerase sigma-70 factor (ECF subfamily)